MSLQIEGENEGFLIFTSKTELIHWYVEKYGAKVALGQRLYFDPNSGKHLIKEYLSRKKNVLDMKYKAKEPREGALTQGMDYGTSGFEELMAIMQEKAQSRTDEERREIKLLAIKYKMEDYIASAGIPEKTAGEFLKDFLRILGIRQKYFAKYINMKPSNLSKVIKGERPVNKDLALIFARLFNHDPMLWIEIQAKNELNRIQSAGKEYESFSLGGLLREQEAAYSSKS